MLRTHAPTAAPPQEDERDDAILIAGAKRDRRAFAPLYRRYVDRVYRYCDRVLGDRERAEDATSLAFTKALAGLPRCRDDAFRSWLVSIAHNVIGDAQRSRQRQTAGGSGGGRGRYVRPLAGSARPRRERRAHNPRPARPPFL